MEVQFGTVECGILLVNVPVTRDLLLENLSEGALSLVPQFEVAHPLLGITGRETDFVAEAERLVHGVEELKGRIKFGFNLVGGTEDVGWGMKRSAHDASKNGVL